MVRAHAGILLRILVVHALDKLRMLSSQLVSMLRRRCHMT